ncbi:MAG: hypothetical protein LBT56_00580 [Prevotellaceae bacterium]|jgi:hypothetical protein|nr:hypothetical protein [Prevotellaceae bacterium]
MAQKENAKYFNFPISLLNGFMDNPKKVLDDISDYCLYAHTLKLGDAQIFEKFETDEQGKMKAACNYFNMKVHTSMVFNNGKILYNNIPANNPKVGLSLQIFWDYYNNSDNKTDFEKACFLAFLAIKSILLNKSYCRITNLYLWSRMSGMAKSVKDIVSLNPQIIPFAKEYQTAKIKKALRDTWGLVYYSRYTRGFYVSFTLNLEQLVLEAESRRKSTKDKQYRERERQAIEKAKNILQTRP